MTQTSRTIPSGLELHLPMLEVRELVKSFRKRLAIHPRVNHVLGGVTFSLPRASIVNLVGENGSGKNAKLFTHAAVGLPRWRRCQV